MIISQTPVRIPLGGGGTDLEAFYKNNGGGFLVSAAINKFVLILVRRNFENGVRFTGYNRKEIVKNRDQLSNPLVRATLEYLSMDEDIEIVSMSDVRTNCGLGTSSAFTVGLLNALYHYQGLMKPPEELAEDAIFIERKMLSEAGGFQDQYSAALGGLVSMEVDSTGFVDAQKLALNRKIQEQFSELCLFVDTKSSRLSSDIQKATISNLNDKSSNAHDSLTEIRSIGRRICECLLNNDVLSIGELMHLHWIEKRKYGSKVSNPIIDELYSYALENGALGGKLMGAGGGGFLMFIAKNENSKTRLKNAFFEKGLLSMDTTIENSGSKIVMNNF